MNLTPERLVGAELLERVAQLEAASKREKAIACGYVTKVKGNDRVAYSAFYEALATASGVPITEAKERKTAELRYRAKVLKNGSVLIGPRYVQMIDGRDGSYLQIAHEGDQLVLKLADDA